VGGLPRRATFIKQETSDGVPTIILDSGNFAAAGPLSEPALEPAALRAALILRTMERMGYRAVAVGGKDLYLGLEVLRSLEDKTSLTFLSANLTDRGGKPVFDSYALLPAGDVTVGVIGLTAPPVDRDLMARLAPGVLVQDPGKALRKAVEAIRRKCDLIVLLSNVGYAKDLELVEMIPGIDILVSGGTRRFMNRPLVQGKTLVTTGYYEGRAVGSLLIHEDGQIRGWILRKELDFLDKQISDARARDDSPGGKEKLEALLKKREPLREQTVYEARMVTLEPSFPDDPTVVEMITRYREELAKAQGNPALAAAGKSGQVRYTGPEACSGCHESRYRFWLTTDHARAFESLAPKKAGADPDCIGCHVTGYMRRTGYWPKAPRDDLRGVQCEACHGVGSLHVGSPEMYSLVHLPTAPQCLDCHTQEQDDDFDYLRDKGKVCGEK